MFSKYPRLCRNIVVQLLFSKKKVLQLLLHIPNCLTSWMRSLSSSLPWRLSPWFHSFGWLRGCMMWVKGGVEICIRTPRPWTAISKRRERRPRQHSPFSSKWQNTNKLSPRAQTPKTASDTILSILKQLCHMTWLYGKKDRHSKFFWPHQYHFKFPKKPLSQPELTKVRSLILKPTVAIPNWSWLTADL